MRSLLAVVAVIVLSSCCSKPCYNYCVYGADQFVCDSYKIRQGKTAILEMQGVEHQEINFWDMEEFKDTIVEDDILTIMVYHPSRGEDFMKPFKFINEMVGGFRVQERKIDLPDIPPLEVEGLTLDEARDLIQEEYRKQINGVDVFIAYKDRLKRKVELAGLVGQPTIPVDGKIRLFETLARAKIATNANLYMSYVLRDDKPIAIDLHKLMNEGDMSQNIVMHGGDKVFLANPSDARVMLAGEIFLPQPINVPYGHISLREALVSAGGIPYTGDRRNIQVIRGNLECPKIYCLTWEHIIHLPNDSLLLMPGDTVFISEKPITKWNRFIAQLMPSLQGVQTGHSVYKLATQK